MEYEGRYTAFDLARIETYPLSTRSNKVGLSDLVFPKDLDALAFDLRQEVQKDIGTVAEAIAAARHGGKPVILFPGAPLLKHGLGPLLVALVAPAHAWLKPKIIRCRLDSTLEQFMAADAVISIEESEDGLFVEAWVDHDDDASTPDVWASMWWGDWAYAWLNPPVYAWLRGGVVKAELDPPKEE